jgi:hypothetical protein
MPQIQNRLNFEPSTNSLTKWLGTKKPGFTAGNNMPMPGFFVDDATDTDTRYFWIAIAIEIIGGIITIIGGAKKSSFFLFISVVGVLLAIILDIFFANKLHANVPKKTYLKSLLTNSNLNPTQRANISMQMNEGKGNVKYSPIVGLIFFTP